MLQYWPCRSPTVCVCSCEIVYYDTTILVWHNTICVSHGLYLDIHQCTILPVYLYTPRIECICKLYPYLLWLALSEKFTHQIFQIFLDFAVFHVTPRGKSLEYIYISVMAQYKQLFQLAQNEHGLLERILLIYSRNNSCLLSLRSECAKWVEEQEWYVGHDSAVVCGRQKKK